MKTIVYSLLGTAAMIAAGCQKTTTTGPATPTTPGTTSTAPRTTPTTPNGTPRTDTRGETKKLTVMAAKDHTVEQGESDDVLITINRDNFDEAVRINLNGLPAGVELMQKNAVIPAEDSSVTLTLQAGANAQVGEHLVTLVAEAPGIEKNTQTFKLKIKAAD